MSARRFAVAACLLLLASCSRPDSANFPRGGDATEAPAAAGDEFFEFSASRLGGGQVTGAEIQGKDVALWFWAPW